MYVICLNWWERAHTHTHHTFLDGNGTVVDNHPKSFPARARQQASCPASTAVSRAELETSAHQHGHLTPLVYLLNAILELGKQEIPILDVQSPWLSAHSPLKQIIDDSNQHHVPCPSQETNHWASMSALAAKSASTTCSWARLMCWTRHDVGTRQPPIR